MSMAAGSTRIQEEAPGGNCRATAGPMKSGIGEAAGKEVGIEAVIGAGKEAEIEAGSATDKGARENIFPSVTA